MTLIFRRGNSGSLPIECRLVFVNNRAVCKRAQEHTQESEMIRDSLTSMSKSSRSGRVPQARENLDAEIAPMVRRVRELFGDEVLATIYDRAHNVAIRQARVSVTPASAATDGRLRLVSSSEDDGFLRTLRDELDRALTHH